MSPDLPHRHEEDEFGDLPQRSIFAQGWFRLILVVIVLLVVAIVALPYALDWWAPPPPPTPLVKAPIPPPPPPLPTAQAPKVEPPKSAPAPPAAKPGPTPPKSAPPQMEARATPKPEAAPAPTPRARRQRAAPAGGEYWIQVGAFKAEANAAGLAARLTAEKYPAKHFALARPVGGTHEVYVVGASTGDVNGKLPSKEYKAEAVGSEVVIRPALPLRDAVTLSKDLATKGLTVKIRRAQEGDTFHVVRVGGYPNRQRARTVQKELAGKGVEGFIVRGEKR